MPQIPEGSKLSQILENLRADVDKIKESSSSPQLGSSSVDVFQGRGFIPVMENGVEKHRIGRQPDGTITSVSKNNTDPPATPNAPICTPFIGGVTVLCDGFLQKQFLDFSHIRVYVDDQLTDCIMKVPGAVAITPLEPGPHTFYLKSVNLSNTASPSSQIVIATPNQVVGADITDGIIDALKLANDAVTEAKVAAGAITNTKIGDNSIDSYKIAAYAIQAINIAAQAIGADQIAANAITAEKIAALAIQADKIAANAITAGKIQAGAVTAEKLAAQIVLAGTAIIVGNPTLARLVLDSSGLTQVDQYGNIVLQIGATPGQGNFLTVIDSTDPSNALATIARDGSITVNGINIAGTAYLNGVDLVNFLNSRPQGIIAQGRYTGEYSAGTSSELGLFEIAFQVIAGRTYQVTSGNFGCYGSVAACRLRFTINGTVPTVNSPIFNTVIVYAGDYLIGGGVTFYDTNPPGQGGANTFASHNHSFTWPDVGASHSILYTPQFTGTVRLLLTIGQDARGQPGSYTTGVNSTWTPTYLRTAGILDLFVSDLGVSPILTGGTNAGGGTTNANGQYVRTFTPTYTRYGQTTGTLQDGLQQGKLGSTNYVSMIGFDQSQISTALNGATVDKCELYLYSNYWSVAEGGQVSIGYHNATGIPNSYSYMQRDWVYAKMKKPQGLWINLPTVGADSLANGYIKGFVLDCTQSFPAATNYGMFRELTYTDATVRPVLRVTYRK